MLQAVTATVAAAVVVLFLPERLAQVAATAEVPVASHRALRGQSIKAAVAVVVVPQVAALAAPEL